MKCDQPHKWRGKTRTTNTVALKIEQYYESKESNRKSGDEKRSSEG